MNIPLHEKIEQPSLRKQLVLWIIAPMLLMILVDTTILYRVATHFIQDSFDAALLDTANDIVELIKISKTPIKQFKLGLEAHEVILSDKLDQVYYNVYDSNYVFINGDQILPLMTKSSTLKGGKLYSSHIVNHKAVRIVTLPAQLKNNGIEKNIYVQVAETLNKRNQLAEQTLVGLILPQLMLLIGAVTMFGFGIKRGLAPLEALNDALLKRSHRELSPIQLDKVPNEVSGLIKSINSLMNQLKSAIELQNRFVADAAHQLKTPLAGIQAQLELADLEQDPTQLQSSLSKANHNVSKLSHMISQLLILAHNQPETSSVFDKKTVNLGELCKIICTEMVPTAYIKNIDLGVELHAEQNTSLEVVGNFEKLRIMLENLIDNAIRYTPSGGKVTVSAERKSEKVILTIEDNGIGIPENERQSVFERFHRVVDNRQEGSGLGLAIVKEIVELHNANIDIEASKTASGTKMVVTFLSNT